MPDKVFVNEWLALTLACGHTVKLDPEFDDTDIQLQEHKNSCEIREGENE